MSQACYQLRRLPRHACGSSGPFPHQSRLFRVAATMRTGGFMDNLSFGSSPRRLLGAVRASTASAPATIFHNATVTAPWAFHQVEPVLLLRTREGRSLSRVRYVRANEFMLPLKCGAPSDWPEFLYGAGIVAQLALSSHLIDVGFPDAWCARHIGLYVANSLDYANATGLGLHCPETARLARVLSPYSKWNCLSLLQGPRPNDDGFTYEKAQALLIALIDHVGYVTGHSALRSRSRHQSSLPL